MPLHSLLCDSVQRIRSVVCGIRVYVYVHECACLHDTCMSLCAKRAQIVCCNSLIQTSLNVIYKLVLAVTCKA